ncbi:hypothetical protein V6N13_101273 [Hibiscus sabdariffa]
MARIIPEQIGNLKRVEWLNLGPNNFVGPIPPSIFNSSTLSSVSFAVNQLSGHLPPTMGLWLPNLEEIYLGKNDLVGPFRSRSPMPLSSFLSTCHIISCPDPFLKLLAI